MDIRERRFNRRENVEEFESAGFEWIDLYPLIGLVGLAGYLILG